MHHPVKTEATNPTVALTGTIMMPVIIVNTNEFDFDEYGHNFRFSHKARMCS